MLAWLRWFVFTQIVEIPIYRRSLGAGFLEAFGASAITHPIVWVLSSSRAFELAWGWRALGGELFAWWVEAAYFHFVFRRPRALLWTLVANGASFGLGLGCWYFLGFR